MNKDCAGKVAGVREIALDKTTVYVNTLSQKQITNKEMGQGGWRRAAHERNDVSRSRRDRGHGTRDHLELHPKNNGRKQ